MQPEVLPPDMTQDRRLPSIVTGDTPDDPHDVADAREPWSHMLALVTAWLADYTGNTRTTYADAIGYPRDPTTGTPRETRTLRHGVTWLDWCAHHRVDPLDVQRVQVMAWVDEIGNTPHPESGQLLAKATRENMVSIVSTFYTWAVEEGYLAANPAQFNRRRMQLSTSGDPSPSRSLTPQEVAALQHAADNDHIVRYRSRTSALVATLFAVGLRVSELVGLTLNDMGIVQGQRCLFLRTKGAKRHIVPLPPEATRRVDVYLANRSGIERRPIPRGSQQVRGNECPLFATSTGKRMFRTEINTVLRRLAESAGLDDPNSITPHVARHSWITTARDAGIPESDISTHVDHADARTTARYGRTPLQVESSPAWTVADAYAQALADRHS